MYQETRREVADRFAEHFAAPEFVTESPMQVSGFTPEEVLTQLVRVPELLRRRPMTLYQLSALMFQGNSKALGDREDWLRFAFGLDEEALIRRPVLIEAYMPENVTGVLLIENLDSYLDAINRGWPGTERFVLIYTSGFRGTAARIRDPRHARLHWSDLGHVDERCRRFAGDWCQTGPFDLPVRFCGDLDWAGFDIYSSLSRVIPGLLPWEPGYNAMLLAQGMKMGHTPEQAGKGDQRFPGLNPSPFLQRIIEEMQPDPRFVDQEVIGAMLAGVDAA